MDDPRGGTRDDGRSHRRGRSAARPGWPDVEPFSSGRVDLLPREGGYRRRAGSGVPHSGENLVRPRRGARRGIAPRSRGTERPGPSSAPARRLLPGRGRGPRTRRFAGRDDLPALRLGTLLAGGAASRESVLPRAHESGAAGLGIGAGRSTGGPERGPAPVRPERGSDRRSERLCRQAGHAGGAILVGRRHRRAALRSDVAGTRPAARSAARGFLPRPDRGQGPRPPPPGLPA